jgi:peptidoglycan hydrolase-like protein with peptidoglycan-binding domain
MALQSARFRGVPRFDQIHAGVTTAYLRFNDQGDEVREVQYALIDLGYSIPSGATGFFGQQTSGAVVQFKTDHALYPNDPVVGTLTITKLDEYFALPFADRDEWLSWKTRRLPQWNFTRLNELTRLNTGGTFTWNPLSAWVPSAFKNAFVSGISELLDPKGSPVSAYAPSATWGVSPLDVYHCHVVLDGLGPTGHGMPWDDFISQGGQLRVRLNKLGIDAAAAGAIGTPAWKAAYRNLLLAPGPAGGKSFNEQTADILSGLAAASSASWTYKPVRLLWHTFEERLWRPVAMTSSDPRRSWWCEVAPNLSAVTTTPFSASVTFSDVGVSDLLQLCFVIDQARVITVIAGIEMDEVGVLVDLNFQDYQAAKAGLPYP